MLVGAGISAAPRAPAVEEFPGGPYFLVVCRFSHRNNDDPIVHPGRPGLSHNHTFFGNRSTNASSTLSSLRESSTSCGIRADTAAYWVPTLYEDGRPVNPLVILAYYTKLTPEPMRPFPAGLKIVAGNADAVRAQSMRVTYWSCGSPDVGRRSSTVPLCSDDEFLNLHVLFPSCWDGRRLDSADHQGHMAYAVAGRCPRSHPVAFPTLAVAVIYPSVGAGSMLSSGRFAGHADFFNAWDQDALVSRVEGLN